MQHLQSGALLQGGKYKVEKALGQGSFGITYLAEHTALGKKVCIKEFFMKELNSRAEDGSITGLSDGSLSYSYAQKFRKEAQNLARMEHPNIVRVTDCFDENGTFYYVMEYIEGQDLNTYIQQHVLSETEAVAIIRDVAQALIYMHDEKHMLHLDLKPGNIMRRNSDGHIYLIDFGLSKHFDNNGAPETSTTIGLGTLGYAPIEQANQAKNGEFRPTIDVYALGATLYKLLTRETPPPASDLVTDDELISEKLKECGVSTEVSAVVVKAMLPNTKKRIQSVKSLLSELCNSVDDDATIKPTQSLHEHGSTHTIESNEETLAQQPIDTSEETVVDTVEDLEEDFEASGRFAFFKDNHWLVSLFWGVLVVSGVYDLIETYSDISDIIDISGPWSCFTWYCVGLPGLYMVYKYKKIGLILALIGCYCYLITFSYHCNFVVFSKEYLYFTYPHIIIILLLLSMALKKNGKSYYNRLKKWI